MVQPVFASRISKGFEALKIYNYFKAKQCFERSVKRHPAAATFGLATIYYRKDNPFHNLDSALRHILLADSTYQLLKEDQKQEYKKYYAEFDYVNILVLKTRISSAFYQFVEKKNTIEVYNEFISRHPWANEFYTATHKRDSLAYDLTLRSNRASSFEKFMIDYPFSEYFNQAKLKFDDLNYAEFTQKGTLGKYLEFIQKFPSSSHSGHAEDKVYDMSTINNTLEEYHAFLKSFPMNRNAGLAWKKIYQLYMTDFSENRIEEFRTNFPEYPYVSELELDVKNSKLQLLPFNRGGSFGFMDYDGNIIISPEYEQAADFHEGLALVVKDGKYGFIDKGNKLVVPFLYSSASDFEKGRSVVQFEDKYGMIDRSGKVIFPFAQRDSLFGYYDQEFNLRIPERFQEAFPFIDSMAKVQINEQQAFIDVYGSFVVAPGYEEIEFFSDTLLIFKDSGLYGLMKLNGEVLLAAQFDRVLKPVIDRTMVVQNGKIGYIDLSGNMVIAPQFELFPNYIARGQFSSNLTVIRSKGKYGLMDKNGKTILAPTFNDLGDVSSLMAFSKGKGWGYTDLLGKVIIPPTYSYAESFSSGSAIVELDGFQGLIDQTGKELLPLKYTSLARLGKEYLVVTDGQKMGLCTSKGKELIPMEYDSIRNVKEGLFVLLKNGELSYFNVSNGTFIIPRLNE